MSGSESDEAKETVWVPGECDLFGVLAEPIECDDPVAASHWDARLWEPAR